MATEGPGAAAGGALGDGGIGAAPVIAGATDPVMSPSDPPGVTVAARVHGGTSGRMAAGTDAARVVLASWIRSAGTVAASLALRASR